MKKGRVTLPILRCARGSTSLESFHLHLARFVPGSSAGAVNFQAYILDGICRWNSAHAAAAVQPPTTETLRTFNSRLQSRVNQLNQSVFGEVVFSRYQPPSKYTGEQFGVRYLYHQTGRSFTSTGDQLDVQIDEGFADVDEVDQPAVTTPLVDQDEHLITVAPPVDPESEEEEEDETTDDDDDKDEAVDSRGIPGWEKVDRLARALLELEGLCVTNAQAKKIKTLYSQLLEYDRRPITYRPRQVKQPRGRFARSKRVGHDTVEAMKRCFLSAGSPASSPAKSRVVEALCIHLCQRHSVSKREMKGGKVVCTTRWRLVISDYSIRARLLNTTALEDTNLILYHINETTLITWYKTDMWRDEIRMLLQGLPSSQHQLVADLTLEGKCGELASAGIPDPTHAAAKSAITKTELAKHCRQRTRGKEKTMQLIEELLLSLSTVTDLLGVPLLKEEMSTIWEEQKKHVKCIQDPPDLQLYTITGHIQKGGVHLPLLRCARGSTSLESFHLHLARFIPGTAANAVNFQAYLVDGIACWNTSRASGAILGADETLRTFNVRVKQKINTLSELIHGDKVFPNFQPPSPYTGKLYGMEYLLEQSGHTMGLTDLDSEIDEGFEEEMAEEDILPNEDLQDPIDLPPPAESESDDDREVEEGVDSDDEALDFRGIPRWDKVDQLARTLIDIKGLSVTNTQAREIKDLYNDLLPFDRKPVTFALKPARGRFARSKYRVGNTGG